MKPPAPVHKSERYSYLDGLRGIAASMVLVQHVLENTPVLAEGTRHPLGIFMLENLNLGRLGVVMFFLISGFLIPSTLKPGSFVLRKFAISRVARLYPLYWMSLFTGAGLALLLGLPMLDAGAFAASLTMLQKGLGIKDLYGPYWTLFVELVFYAGCVALFIAGQLYRPQRVLGLVLLGVAVSVGVSVATLFTGGMGALHGALLQLGGLGNYLLVMLTGYLFRLHRDGKLGGKGLVSACAGIVVCYLAYAVSRTQLGSFEESLMPRAIFISTVVGLVAFWLTDRYRLWQQASLAYVGMISYGLYLFHAQVIHVGVWLIGGPALTLDMIVALMVFVGLATALLAHAMYYVVEKRGIEIGLRMRRKLDTK